MCNRHLPSSLSPHLISSSFPALPCPGLPCPGLPQVRGRPTRRALLRARPSTSPPRPPRRAPRARAARPRTASRATSSARADTSTTARARSRAAATVSVTRMGQSCLARALATSHLRPTFSLTSPPPSPFAPRRVADSPDLLRGDVPGHQRYRIDHHGGRLVHRRRGLRQPDVRLHMREWLRDDWLEPDHVRKRR